MGDKMYEFFDFSYLKVGQSYGRKRIKREAAQTVENRLSSHFYSKKKRSGLVQSERPYFAE